MLALMDEAIEQECNLCGVLYNDEVFGFSLDAIRDFLRFTADKRLRAIGLPVLYNQKHNPFEHLDRIAELDSKANFFEDTVTTYPMAHAIGNWDF